MDNNRLLNYLGAMVKPWLFHSVLYLRRLLCLLVTLFIKNLLNKIILKHFIELRQAPFFEESTQLALVGAMLWV